MWRYPQLVALSINYKVIYKLGLQGISPTELLVLSGDPLMSDDFSD
jgi:hypothetical protein